MAGNRRMSPFPATHPPGPSPSYPAAVRRSRPTARRETGLSAAAGLPRGNRGSAAHLLRERDRLAARGRAELAEDVLDVRADRLAGQHEARGDLLGRAALVEEVDDLPLARGERRLDRAQARRALGDAAQVLDQAHAQP